MTLTRRLSLFLLMPLAATQAQSTARLHGIVVDSSHSPIAGARVNILSQGRPIVETQLSNQAGDFTLALEPGQYTIRTSKEHFALVTREVDLSAAGLDLEIVLAVGAMNTTVIVSEDAGYRITATKSATKTLTPVRDIPQSITSINQKQIQDQLLLSIADVVQYVPGVTAIQGENNRDQLVIRGNSTSADFFLDGVRDDVQYFRDLYNLDRVEVLKGPNALIFGRGGAGGVVNRVTKEAGETAIRELTFSGGSYGDKRVTVDLNQPLGKKAAFRLNGMYENSGTFRDYVDLERYGVNPTLTFAPGQNTRLTIGFENFQDHRGSDRGIPSFAGRPIDTASNTFFGNPEDNKVRAIVNIGTVAVEHQWDAVHLTNRTSIANYDRGYQNFVPGAVTADGLNDSLSAYNNATKRRNVFNQTDTTYAARTGALRHTLLAGMELGRQLTENFRNTGYFNNTSTTLLVPLTNPVFFTPVTFRQNTTDANNHLETNLGALYVQDQIELSKHLQAVAGVRFDYFDLQYHDNRSGTNLRRIDHLVSPRAGLIYKPATAVSLYASYSISYLPSSGDQFSSLTTITQQVKPEKFSNYEMGAKWDLSRRIAFTTALYRLDRTNTRATDPNDATRIVQTGSQRTNGVEIGVSGRVTRKWRVSGGYAYQDAFVTAATTSARARAQVAQVPHNTFSLWNNYSFSSRLSAGLGLLNRSDMFAAIDDSVRLPGYFRADAALYYLLTEKLRFQLNVKNLANSKYFLNADNNTNISPGSPRTIVAGLIFRF